MKLLSDDNLAYPVLIESDNGSSGSGFFLNRNDVEMFLVSARHVLYKLSENIWVPNCKKEFYLTCYTHDPKIIEPIKWKIDIHQLLKNIFLKFHPSEDIAVIKIGNWLSTPPTASLNIAKVINFKTTEGVSIVSNPPNGMFVVVNPGSIKKFENVNIASDVFIAGYPSSIGHPTIKQIDSRYPLWRKGIVAGKNYSNRTIILDCPAYYGNSGGIAIESDKENVVIGLVSQFIPFIEILESKSHGYQNISYENSGYSVVTPIDTIYQLIDLNK